MKNVWAENKKCVIFFVASLLVVVIILIISQMIFSMQVEEVQPVNVEQT
jgi:hypothetical protein